MKTHKCFVRINKRLKTDNTRLVTNLLDTNMLFIETEMIERKRGRRAKKVLASHCPFCGEELPGSGS